MSDAYHDTRLAEDPKRGAVWRALWRYFFRHRIGAEDTVLDLGAGYCDFVNAVRARRRIALDLWEGITRHAAPGVETIVGTAGDLAALPAKSVDYAFASNLVEHLSQAEFVTMLEALARVLSDRGSFTMLQPNYRYAYKEYFDDYTHVAVYSHISLADLLASCGWQVVEVRKRFLPLTVKSRLPSWGFLIAAYLASPVKPMGKQMLLVAQPRRS
ncbi:methyltransferase domain-containing protein [Sphingomonas aracearum]|uniref:Class I SAM-dependent methyltransferase n=1 Tax=Sphingomonas aracearum TaxID=2283317 RepID=A0A369VSK2_9SPHN|nr:class I SAM-dependent methyltransferase [Sphingomonas aracearum]RDE05003.1 class I SAM-dependent methyltransferase [Sphingomonas aracearum]